MDAHEQLSPVEARILGALIEKAETTPDNYPLSTNALMAACNQSTNREPVMDIAERDIDQTMMELRQRGFARTLSGTGHRVPKHRHIVDEALGLDGDETAVLAVLLLRGAQTLNEITTRTERYAAGPAGDGGRVDAAIDRLATRAEPLAVRLERRPGEREPRIDQLWATAQTSEPDAAPPAAAPNLATAPENPVEETTQPDRVAALERQVSELTDRLTALEAALGIDSDGPNDVS